MSLKQDQIFPVLWELLMDEIYEFHSKELVKLKEQERGDYLKNITELEYKVWVVRKIGGRVSLNLAFHKDFPKIWDKFIPIIVKQLK